MFKITNKNEWYDENDIIKIAKEIGFSIALILPNNLIRMYLHETIDSVPCIEFSG